MKTSMLLVATQMHNPAFNQELKSKDKKEEKEKRIKKKVGNCGWKKSLYYFKCVCTESRWKHRVYVQLQEIPQHSLKRTGILILLLFLYILRWKYGRFWLSSSEIFLPYSLQESAHSWGPLLDMIFIMWPTDKTRCWQRTDKVDF